ncbi:MAG TPA: phosphoglucosamine mutase, partial [bacterium]|nr:phosphoglucosamine mutase [bacterium]
GRDTRTSGEMVQHAVLAGLASAGCKVITLDICPVPTIQLAVRQTGASGGIAITASHNPVEWNALKFIRGDGCFLNYYQARELLDIYHQGDYAKVYSNDMRIPRRNNKAVENHIKAIIDNLDKLPASKGAIRVVVDCVNGAGSVMSAKLLRRLGCTVFTINDTPDGIFPRPPEPLPENLGALCDAVRRHDAHIGFAQDADADRLAIVSEKGLPIGEDYTLAIAVDHILSKKHGNVVVNLSTTSAVDDIVEKHGCRIIKSKIGEINVTETMKAEKAVIGGEGNGGVIYPEVNFCRDSFTAMAIALHYICDKNMPVSKLVSKMPYYSMIKKTVPCPPQKAQELTEMLYNKHKGKNIDMTDGIKISSGKNWVLIRPSNTEPILRVITEAPTIQESSKLNEKYAAEVNNFLSSI